MSTMRVHWRPGFAWLKLLLVVVVFVVALGVGITLIDWARRASEVKLTMSNLSQCAKAVHLCHDNNKKFPPYYGQYGGSSGPVTFHAHLLPFVDELKLYTYVAGIYPPPHWNVAASEVPSFLSNLDPTQWQYPGGAYFGKCNFPVNLRLFYTEGGLGTLSTSADLIYPRMPTSFEKDGTSHTLLFATKYGICGPGASYWLDPDHNAPTSVTAATFGVSMQLWQQAPPSNVCDPRAGTAVSFRPGYIQVAMCDASVRTVAVGVSQATWQAAHTPNAGDKLGSDWDQ